MFGQMANLLNANMLQDPSNNPWLFQNGPGRALGAAGSALGVPGSALGGAPNMFNASLGAAPSALGSSFGGAAKQSLLQGPGSLGLMGNQVPADVGRYGLDMSKKAGFFSKLGGMDFANMGVGAANAVGLPQAIFGRPAGSALGQGASGALSGMAMGGPVGAGVGGGLGLLTGLMSGKSGGGQKAQVPVQAAQAGLYENMV